jgi:outer membrane protein TolC
LRVTLASNVALGVIQEQMLVEQIALLEEALQLADRQLAHGRGLTTAGYASGLDLAQQEAARAQTAAQLPPLRKQLEQTRHLLALLCGDFPAADLGQAQAPVQVPAALPRAAFATGQPAPRRAGAEAQLHAAFAQIGVARANRLPQLSSPTWRIRAMRWAVWPRATRPGACWATSARRSSPPAPCRRASAPPRPAPKRPRPSTRAWC